MPRRYFARVGRERIELAAEHKDGPLQTSARVREFEVTQTVADVELVGFGDSISDAEADLERQLPKGDT